jgi:hypothetical protein
MLVDGWQQNLNILWIEQRERDREREGKDERGTVCNSDQQGLQ